MKKLSGRQKKYLQVATDLQRSYKEQFARNFLYNAYANVWPF